MSIGKHHVVHGRLMTEFCAIDTACGWYPSRRSSRNLKSMKSASTASCASVRSSREQVDTSIFRVLGGNGYRGELSGHKRWSGPLTGINIMGYCWGLK